MLLIREQDKNSATDIAAAQEVKNIKVTICGPTWMHLRHGSEHTYDDKVYANDGALRSALPDHNRVLTSHKTPILQTWCKHTVKN